jgi:hypothetical protein
MVPDNWVTRLHARLKIGDTQVMVFPDGCSSGGTDFKGFR